MAISFFWTSFSILVYNPLHRQLHPLFLRGAAWTVDFVVYVLRDYFQVHYCMHDDCILAVPDSNKSEQQLLITFQVSELLQIWLKLRNLAKEKGPVILFCTDLQEVGTLWLSRHGHSSVWCSVRITGTSPVAPYRSSSSQWTFAVLPCSVIPAVLPCPVVLDVPPPRPVTLAVPPCPAAPAVLPLPCLCGISIWIDKEQSRLSTAPLTVWVIEMKTTSLGY